MKKNAFLGAMLLLCVTMSTAAYARKSSAIEGVLRAEPQIAQKRAIVANVPDLRLTEEASFQLEERILQSGVFAAAASSAVLLSASFFGLLHHQFTALGASPLWTLMIPLLGTPTAAFTLSSFILMPWFSLDVALLTGLLSASLAFGALVLLGAGTWSDALFRGKELTPNADEGFFIYVLPAFAAGIGAASLGFLSSPPPLE